MVRPGHWGSHARPMKSGGRGAAWFVDGPFGGAVLRHYLRGGLAARISRDRHLWRGADRMRSFAEFRLLRALPAQVPGAAPDRRVLRAQGPPLSRRDPARAHRPRAFPWPPRRTVGRHRAVGGSGPVDRALPPRGPRPCRPQRPQSVVRRRGQRLDDRSRPQRPAHSRDGRGANGTSRASSGPC